MALLSLAALLGLSGGCKSDGDEDDDAGDNEDGDIEAGSTAIVAILNPVVNDAHSVAVPDVLGSARGGIAVHAEIGDEALTDDWGLAVVEAEVGARVVSVGGGDAPALLDLEVLAEGDVYDAPIAWDGDSAQFFPLTPIRSAVGETSGAVYLEEGTSISDIETQLETNGVVVVLRPGVYEGDLEIRGHDVLLFGEGFSGGEVTIDGSVVALGEGIRLRGLTIAGNVTAAGDDFGMSFSVVHGDAEITGDGGAFLRNVFCGAASVPTDDAALLDNQGLAPLTPVDSPACE